jgi:putative ABC transport system substrate-binding protein
LREIGYDAGKTIDVEWRYANGRTDQLAAIAAELTSMRVDLIVVPSAPEALAAKQAGSTPLVMVSVGDPVGLGLANSLENPGGNATGLIFNPQEFPTHRLELLVESVPSARRVAMLWNSANPAQGRPVTFTQLAAERLGIELQSIEVQGAEEFDDAFRQAVDASADAVLIIPDQLFNLPETQARLRVLAEQNRMPTMHISRGAVEAGGLIAYSVVNPALYRRAADYVAKILNGAQPATLAIEPPPEFELVLNQGAADAIGFTFPPSILSQADTVLP